MIRYFQAANSEAVEFLAPHLLADDGVPTEVFIAQLNAILVKAPEQLLIVIAYDDEQEESQSLRGFIIAYAFDHVPYVHISQCHVLINDPDEPVTDMLRFWVSTWADKLGKKKLRMETHRDPRGFTRRYGFKLISHMMELELSDDLERKVADRINRLTQLKEDSNVQGRTENSQLPDGPAEADRGLDSPVPETPNWSGSDTVLGTDSSGVDSPVPASAEPDIEQLAQQVRERNGVSS